MLLFMYIYFTKTDMHKIIPRVIEKKLRYFATKFPVISLTGSRQSGKTTILKKIRALYLVKTCINSVA